MYRIAFSVWVFLFVWFCIYTFKKMRIKNGIFLFSLEFLRLLVSLKYFFIFKLLPKSLL